MLRNVSNLCDEKTVSFHADPNVITFHNATVDSLPKNCLATQTKENAYMHFFPHTSALKIKSSLVDFSVVKYQ